METRGDNGRQDLRKADTPWETMGDQEGATRGDNGDKTIGKADSPSNRGKQEGVITMGDKGRQDPREGGHTIQQLATRRGTMGDKGRQNPR